MVETCIMDISPLHSDTIFQEYLSYFSEARITHILRYRQPIDQRRSLAASILYAKMLEGKVPSPAKLDWSYGPYGKPKLEYYPHIHFNVSHSGKYAVCSVGELEVGVDIEEIDSVSMRVAERFFAPSELNWIHRLNDNEVKSGCSRIWTLRESLVKADGHGVSVMNQFSLDPFRTQIRTTIDGHEYTFAEYVIPGYRIAVCSQVPCEFAEDLKWYTLKK